MTAIFGANGFIGRNLALYIQEKRPMLFARDYDGFPDTADQSCHIADFKDLDSFWDTVSKAQTVILLSNTGHEGQGAVEAYASFVDALNTRPHSIKHLIYASSGGAMYGEASEPLNEDSPKNPVNTYGKTKLAIEDLLLNCTCPTTVLRIANPIGLYAKRPNLVDAALDAVKSERPLEIWGDGAAVRDYFDVQDLCRAIQLISNTTPQENKIYNIGSGQGRAINEMLDIIAQITDKEVPVEYKNARTEDVSYNVLDCSRIQQELGWQAEIDIRETIEKMWKQR